MEQSFKTPSLPCASLGGDQGTQSSPDKFETGSECHVCPSMYKTRQTAEEVIIATAQHYHRSCDDKSYSACIVLFFGKGLLPQESRDKSINIPFHLGGKSAKLHFSGRLLE